MSVSKDTTDRVKAELDLDVKCYVIDAYTILPEIDASDSNKIAQELLIDPINESYALNSSKFHDKWRFEVVSIDHSLKHGIFDLLGKDLDVYQSRLFVLEGSFDLFAIEQISKLFYNQEQCFIYAPGESPRYLFTPNEKKQITDFEYVVLPSTSKTLLEVSKNMNLDLNIDELKAVRAHYKLQRIINSRNKFGLEQNITDVELQAISKIWSEKYAHKLFNAKITYEENGEVHSINSLFRTFIQSATDQVKKPYVVSAFRDNAGIIKFNHSSDIVVKVEAKTHDKDSGTFETMIDVQRHILGTGMGAKQIAAMDVICTNSEKKLKGVLADIAVSFDYTGIPIVNGSFCFEKQFESNPFIYCGGIGVLPTFIFAKSGIEKIYTSGHKILLVGNDPNMKSNISFNKMISDFIIEARDMLLYSVIANCSSDGIISSIIEMSLGAGGCDIYLDQCLSKNHALKASQILVSRDIKGMVISTPIENIDQLKQLGKKHNVSVSVIGDLDNSGAIKLFYMDRLVCYLDLDFLHTGLPQLELSATWSSKSFPKPNLNETDLVKILMKLLASPHIKSKEGYVDLFNMDAGARSVVKPKMFSPSDAAVLRVVYNSNEGLVVSNGVCPKYVQDGYALATLAFDEAVRNALATGAKLGYLVSLDNFCWPDSIKSNFNGNYGLAQLIRACIGLYDSSVNYGIPIISGKDSCYFDKNSDSIALLITVVGKIDDVRNAITPEFKRPGDHIYLLGQTSNELGGSEYYRLFGGVGDEVPKVNFAENMKIYKAISSAMEDNLVSSCHDISDGGLAVALAEMSFPSGFGVDFDLSILHSSSLNEDALLFSETPGRFIACVSPDNVSKFEQLFENLKFARAGRVRGDKRFVIRRDDKILVNEHLENLQAAWSDLNV